MRTLIIGGVGSGKTTLAKYLSEFFDRPYFSIDSIVYDENNIKRDEKEQTKLVNKINRENKEYIIEGVLRDNLDFLLNICDQIIFLDYPSNITVRRVKFRFFKQKLGIKKCDYVPDKEMYHNMIKWCKEFNRDKLMNKLSKYSKKLLIIRNDRELKVYYKYLEKNKFYL